MSENHNKDIADASSAFQNSLPTHPDTVIKKLERLNISVTQFSHPALRTVEDSKLLRDDMLPVEQGGGHIKNFYLRDHKKNNYLAVIQEDTIVDLKQLADQMQSGRLSFGSPDRLFETLGVRPGAVTPLAMINGASKAVRLALDSSLLNADLIYMHPLVNDRTIAISPADLLVFLDDLGVKPLQLSFL